VVKHAARTIVQSLSHQDRLAVVAFSDSARVVIPLTYMTPDNQEMARRKIDDLAPLYSTNLYDGLHTAMEMIRTDVGSSNVLPSTNANVMLLTDGMPNVSPPRGELETLRRYLDSHPEQSAVRISTFGFGYQLQSRLLSDLAQLGGSMYAFIPDASFVGTIFINSIANILSAASPHGATLKLESAPGVGISNCTSGHKLTPASWGAMIEIPCILYGQSIDVLVELSGQWSVEPFSVTLEMKGLEQPLECCTELIDPLDTVEDGLLTQATIRSELIQFIQQSENIDKPVASRNLDDLHRAQQLLKETKARVKSLADGTTIHMPNIQGMIQDLEGQVTEAYSKPAYYKKWGSHYVLSLAGAHSLQQCINFKDPGIQDYGTKKFEQIRDVSEELFLKLEPPKPSRRATAPVATMGAYYSASAPCFAAGTVTIKSSHHSTKSIDISQLKAGDQVVTGDNGKTARVKCIVETPTVDGTEALVELGGGVLVTPWHPCRLVGSNTWTFPCFLAPVVRHPCRIVYSFVLEGDISLRLGNSVVDGIALGHGVIDSAEPILEHAYLGTRRVIDDLSNMAGWEEGRVRLAANPTIRDNNGKGRIIGFRQAELVDEKLIRDTPREASDAFSTEVNPPQPSSLVSAC